MPILKKLKKRVVTALKKPKRQKHGPYPDMPKDPETLAKIIFDVADYKAFGPGKRKPRIQ